MGLILLAPGFWLLASSLSAFSLRGEIIDRTVAVVEGFVITQSDIRQERDIRVRLGEKAIDDDKLLLQELIENHLIESQIADFPDMEVGDAEVDADLAKSREGSGAASAAIREAVRKRIRMAKYFDKRFRQFIRTTDEDVRKYYDEVFVPAARTRGVNPIPPFDQVADAVRENVVRESMDHEVTIWLEAIRRRSNIEAFE